MVTSFAFESVCGLQKQIAIVFAADRSLPKGAKKHAENAGKNILIIF